MPHSVNAFLVGPQASGSTFVVPPTAVTKGPYKLPVNPNFASPGYTKGKLTGRGNIGVICWQSAPSFERQDPPPTPKKKDSHTTAPRAELSKQPAYSLCIVRRGCLFIIAIRRADCLQDNWLAQDKVGPVQVRLIDGSFVFLPVCITLSGINGGEPAVL